MFPCIFTGKQDKEQEAESSSGICGLNLEATQPSGPLETGSVKEPTIQCDFSLGCNFDLYTKGIRTCLLLSPLALLALP